MKRARQSVEPEVKNQNQEKEGIDECGIIDWSKFREMKTLNYVLEQKGLGSLKEMAAMELDGEMEDEEDTRDPEEAAKELALTVKDWEDQYLRSVRISQVQKVKCQQFITDLINSSLTIKDAEDGIGTLSTSVIINSGDLTLDWDELFEAEPTKIQALTACLVYASIFIPAMVVKSYKIFSATNLLKLVNAPSIRVEWTALINGRKRHTKLIVPKGEMQFMEMKASHLKRNSQDWWMQLVKPMNISYENEYGQNLKYHAKTGKFYMEGKTQSTHMTAERIAAFTVETQILFYFYAKIVLSANQKLWKCLHERLRALNLSAASNTAKGSKIMSTLQEFWYFKNR